MLKLKQAGDTIIEVLVALAVLGLTLGISYASARRSLNLGRDSQERGEATKIAESQIELMKTVPVSLDPLVASRTTFCMLSTTTGVLPHSTGFVGGAGADSLTSDNPNGYPPECQNSFYRISVRPSGSGGNQDFKVQVRWDGLSGSRSEVILRYTMRES